MKQQFRNILLYTSVISAFTVASCDNSGGGTVEPDETTKERWITVAGALMEPRQATVTVVQWCTR